MTTTEHLNEARKHIGLAVGQHPDASALDAATRALLAAVGLLDLARRAWRCSDTAACDGCDGKGQNATFPGTP